MPRDFDQRSDLPGCQLFAPTARSRDGRWFSALNALFPIQGRVLRKGFTEAGQEWMAELGRALTDSEGGIRDGGAAAWPVGPEASRDVSVYQRGLVAWIAVARMREHWPGQRFDSKGGYLEYSRTFSRAAHGIADSRIETQCASLRTSVQSTPGKLP